MLAVAPSIVSRSCQGFCNTLGDFPVPSKMAAKTNAPIASLIGQTRTHQTTAE